MTDQQQQNSMAANPAEEPDLVKWIGLGFIIGLVVAVITLEMYGYIKHPSELDKATIAEFKLLSLQTDAKVRVSEKNSGKEAFCANDYLLVRPTNGNAVAGILVDKKNRPIQCRYGFAKTDAEARYLKQQQVPAAEPGVE